MHGAAAVLLSGAMHPGQIQKCTGSDTEAALAHCCLQLSDFLARRPARPPALQPAHVVAVADLGSTDGTAEVLEALGANVTRVSVQPFRFDTARNVALSLLPHDCDLCAALDLSDELQPGWADALQAEWVRSGGTVSEVRSTYVSQFKKDGVTPAAQLQTTRIHLRSGYRWDGPSHEVLKWMGRGVGADSTVPTVLPHVALHSKAGGANEDCWDDVCRRPYLHLLLLELGTKEDPSSPRRSYYCKFRGFSDTAAFNNGGL